MPLANGPYVGTAGKVIPGTVGPNSYNITDGSSKRGIKIVTPSTPAVQPGSTTSVTGAAGFEGTRVIYTR
ncbi:MAG: hypothetical protein WCL39_07200 [Armatimonadota bacterium]